MIELDNGGASTPSRWAPTAWLDLQAFHYDNRGNPEAVTPTLQWAGGPSSTISAAVLSFGDWQVKAQGMVGRR